MSTGGIFTLITNDGKQDRMLMATQLLNTRLQQIQRMRTRNRVRDPTPTLVDIERTHILFMNAHFKPFAAIGYEYNKVQPQSGTANFGSEIQFSIPQFGDFFNDMVVNVKISEGDVAGTAPANAWRWADKLGERLFQKVAFTVNGNPLDEYTSDVYKFHDDFFVTPNKRTGWNRCVGQQDCIKGSRQLDSGNVLPSAGAIPYVSGTIANLEQCVEFSNGLQTPKKTHRAFELWVPLIFWFNKDPRLSIPSVSIPYGQRFITITLAALDDCARIGFNKADTFAASQSGAVVPFTTTPTITEASLYINNIFVNPEIHDIFIKRIGFNLIRVHRIQTQRLTKASDRVLLSSLKWPIETMYTGVRPLENVSGSSAAAVPNDTMGSWNKFSGVDPTRRVDIGGTGDVASFAPCYPTLDKTTISAHGIDIYKSFPHSFFNSYVPYNYGGHHINTPEDCGSQMITFNFYPGSYQPSGHINISRAREFYYEYSASTVSVARDAVGTSGARAVAEDWIKSDQPADLIIVAVAINFLLISDGSAVLRYTT